MFNPPPPKKKEKERKNKRFSLDMIELPCFLPEEVHVSFSTGDAESVS
jgi:hypothetical protein